ncbi:MAG: DEAD/DEAH box helicase family protein [Erysipelotrichaceae bacterium]|nr:DEAD/DEAH box helicase family protein [Erysipelotrichaceae bacterium]
MRCPRCLNSDPYYFYKGSKGWMCRRCVGFRRILIDEEYESEADYEIRADVEEYVLDYPLTEAQKEVAHQCALSVVEHDVVIEAVCGAGKTEMVMETIRMALSMHKRIGFAVARRQVVLELADRLAKAFRSAKVVAVCQGYTNDVEGDLIVCTTHQCYRYYQYFDYLILDEPDAFPYKGNVVLQGIVRTSCRGHIIYMSATLDDYLKDRLKDKDVVHLYLSQRPHGHPLPVPKVRVAPLVFLLYQVMNASSYGKKVLVFVPTIKWAKILGRVMNTAYVTSASGDKQEKIDEFRRKERGVLIATTILERGVTFPGIDVIVFLADHGVFDEASLIQMSGRVGRSFSCPSGKCLFLCNSVSEEVKKCVKSCEKANHAVSVLS